jgi:ubiquinol-cytochrome c reductase subunit 8
VSYGVSLNRQNPFAGAAHDAVFNTFRRVSSQIFYWAPPMVAGYYLLNWAIDRYVLSFSHFHLLELQEVVGGGFRLIRAPSLTECRRNHYLNSKPGRVEFGAEEH